MDKEGLPGHGPGDQRDDDEAQGSRADSLQGAEHHHSGRIQRDARLGHCRLRHSSAGRSWATGSLRRVSCGRPDRLRRLSGVSGQLLFCPVGRHVKHNYILLAAATPRLRYVNSARWSLSRSDNQIAPPGLDAKLLRPIAGLHCVSKKTLYTDDCNFVKC